MSPDILIIRDGDGYRLLHGHLRLVSRLAMHGEAVVDVRDEGNVKVLRTRDGYFAVAGGRRLPVRRN